MFSLRWGVVSPVFRAQGDLGGDCSLKGFGRRGEHGIEGITHRLEDRPLVGFDRLTQDGVVAHERLRHPLRIVFPEFGAPLDVGEEKGDETARQVHNETPPYDAQALGTKRTGVKTKRHVPCRAPSSSGLQSPPRTECIGDMKVGTVPPAFHQLQCLQELHAEFAEHFVEDFQLTAFQMC